MTMLYFSGTGNSKYIANGFATRMVAACHSIEENIDFASLIKNAKTIAFCYPIYGSCVPRIMREFVRKYKPLLCNKRLIIFCTQMMFSGDGAKAFYRLLGANANAVIYAEHFNLPNNISNFWLFPVTEGEKKRKVKAAGKKLNMVCANIKKGKIVRRGWGYASHVLGLVQSFSWPKIEEKNKSSFKANADCNHCGLCAKICPAKNLVMGNAKIEQQNSCVLCYRCVNACPQKAATVLLHAKVKKQYRFSANT